tara:strand:+ start:4 stop:1104 length:1101 start_codon:yes stop_codon:yes gene_type:complete
MGTLRLKRGTKTALQTNPGFTPAEGELVYTTDSKEVFVGDGVTQGGVPVSVSTQNLEDLGNVQALAAQKDQILVYNGSNWAATENPALDVRGNIYGDDSTLLVDAINGKIVGPVETTSVSATTITGNLVGDTQGSHTGSVVGNTLGNHTGDVTGDLTGSVFADDSTVMIDGQAGEILGVVKGTIQTTAQVQVTTNTSNNEIVNGVGLAEANALAPKYIGRSSNGTVANPTAVVGGTDGDGLVEIQGRGYDGAAYTTGGIIRIATSLDTTVSSGVVPGRIQMITANDSGTLANLLVFNHEGKLGIGLPRPDEKLHVVGNAKVTGFVQFGSLTTAERDALTAVNGMVIYNSSTNKFQGYENGSWANLI